MELLPSPPVGFFFSVIFEGLPGFGLAAALDTRFTEISGLEAQLEVETVTEAGAVNVNYQLPLRVKYPNLVLKRASTTIYTSLLTKWAYDAIYNFQFKLCTVNVTLMNDLAMPLKSWTFDNAYPVKITTSPLNAMQGQVVIETLEIAYRNSRQLL